MDLLLSLISGAIGGNIAAGLFKTLNLGLAVNSLAGLLGGVLGGYALARSGLGGLAQTSPDNAALDTAALTAQLAAGSLGGGVILLLAGLLRNALTR